MRRGWRWSARVTGRKPGVSKMQNKFHARKRLFIIFVGLVMFLKFWVKMERWNFVFMWNFTVCWHSFFIYKILSNVFLQVLEIEPRSIRLKSFMPALSLEVNENVTLIHLTTHWLIFWKLCVSQFVSFNDRQTFYMKGFCNQNIIFGGEVCLWAFYQPAQPEKRTSPNKQYDHWVIIV